MKMQKTFKRLDGLDNIENPIIICNEEQRFIVAEQMKKTFKKFTEKNHLTLF